MSGEGGRTPRHGWPGRWARVGLALVAGAAAACGGGRQAPLVVTLDRAPSTLDPQHHNELVGWSLLCNFYDALVRFSPEMRIEPALAQSWSVQPGNRVRFVLRLGVRSRTRGSDGRCSSRSTAPASSVACSAATATLPRSSSTARCTRTTPRGALAARTSRVDVPARYDGWLWGAGFRWRR